MDLAAAAVAYASAGIAVFPLQPRAKKPYGNTPGLHAASHDPALVAAWWAGRTALPIKPDAAGRRQPFASAHSNIGIATGEISSFWVVDLDGPVAEDGLQALIDRYGPLPETVEQRTGQGRHLCFAWDGGFQVRNSASVIGPKIDVRGNGGYIVAPPSIHPSGRPYAWCARRAPSELGFAAAPDWLLRLAASPEKPAAPAKAYSPTPRAGRASPWGDACLGTACRTVAAAPPGKRLTTVFNYAAFIGGLVAGGEIQREYAKAELMRAGFAQVQERAWGHKELETIVENGLRKGEPHPQTAPERRPFERATPRQGKAEPSPVAAAVDVRDARQLYAASRDANCGAVRDWFKLRGLCAGDLPAALGQLRAHAAAPIGDEIGPALLIPLTASTDPHAADVEGLAVIPLQGDHDRPTHFVGERRGKVARLTPWPDGGELLIAVDLQDLWALGANAAESGHDLGLVLAPTLHAFAGGFLGDRYGRTDPAMPFADPEDPPWTASGVRSVWLAVRGDLRTPQLKERRLWGGTAREIVQGEAAGRFYGGLAEQAWRRAGATKVNILRPTRGVGFSKGWGA